MSRDITQIKRIKSPPAEDDAVSPASQPATDFQAHRPLASIMEINSHDPIDRLAGSATSQHNGLVEVLGSLVDLIAEFDGTGVLLDVWTGDKSLLVRPVEEMLGQPLLSIIGDEAYTPFRSLFERIHKSAIAEDFEYSLNLADGHHSFIARAVPVDAPNGQRTIRVLVQDVTGLRKIEEHSRKMESLLKQTQEIANVGSWEYDVERRAFLWSEQMYRMLGIEPGSDTVTLDTACQMFHPEDRARAWQDVMTLIETGKPLENELRFQSTAARHASFSRVRFPSRTKAALFG